MKGEIYLSGISCKLGELVDIGKTTISKAKVEELRGNGLSTYSSLDGETLTEIAKQAISGTIDSTGIEAEKVDAVIFCTSSYWFYEQLKSPVLGKMLCKLGLCNSDIIVSSVMGCHNAITALRIAKNLILAEDMNNVIVVTCDMSPEGDSRLSEDQTVVGDGAASCLVTADNSTGEYKMLDLIATDKNEMYKFSESDSKGDFMKMATEWLKGIMEISRKILVKNELNNSEIDGLVINNYNVTINDSIRTSTGIPEEKTVPFNSDYGHVWSSDIFIGLETMQNKFDENLNKVLLVASGKQNYGAVILERQ